MLIFSWIISAAFVGLCCIGMASILWVMFFSIRIMFQFKNSADAFSRKTLWNPLNAIFNPDVLSERGLGSRRRIFRGLLVFLFSFVLSGAIALILKVLS